MINVFAQRSSIQIQHGSPENPAREYDLARILCTGAESLACIVCLRFRDYFLGPCDSYGVGSLLDADGREGWTA